MSLGLILLDDVVDLYVLGRKLEITGVNTLHFETVREMEMKIYTDCKDNADLEFVTTDEIAHRLTTYDHVLPY